MVSPVVTTDAGAVAGERHAAGWVYRTIPYADPPTGRLRFRAPVRRAAWAGVRPPSIVAHRCPQTAEAGAPESEDCLTLDVWTPDPGGGGLPVMVWLHGGGLARGSGAAPAHDGRGLNARGVVLVTLNYRLHAFGFLHLDGVVSGFDGVANVGLLDQLAALEWVQRNIAGFGGDPARVTLFGESGGAWAVAALLASPRRVGLFSRAIVQSGGGDVAVPADVARDVARRFLAAAGLDHADADALAELPAAVVVTAAERVRRTLLDDGVLRVPMSFVPVVDGAVLGGVPEAQIAAGAARGVDLLTGWCADEARAMVLGPLAGDWPVPEPGVDVLTAYRRAMPGVADVEVLAAVSTDVVFAVPQRRLAAAQSAHAASYLYRFSWRSPAHGGAVGAAHFLDVPFVFGTFDSPFARALLDGAAVPAALARQVPEAWASFAASGTPAAAGMPAWPRFDPARPRLMSLDDPCAVEPVPVAPVEHRHRPISDRWASR